MVVFYTTSFSFSTNSTNTKAGSVAMDQIWAAHIESCMQPKNHQNQSFPETGVGWEEEGVQLILAMPVFLRVLVQQPFPKPELMLLFCEIAPGSKEQH